MATGRLLRQHRMTATVTPADVIGSPGSILHKFDGLVEVPLGNGNVALYIHRIYVEEKS
jgi:hypothetical protein